MDVPWQGACRAFSRLNLQPRTSLGVFFYLRQNHVGQSINLSTSRTTRRDRKQKIRGNFSKKLKIKKPKSSDLLNAGPKGHCPLIPTLCRGKNGDVWSQQEVCTDRDGKKRKNRAEVFAASLFDVHLHLPLRGNRKDLIALKIQNSDTDLYLRFV